MLDDLRGRWLGTLSATHGHPAWPASHLSVRERNPRSIGFSVCAARVGTWQIGKVRVSAEAQLLLVELSSSWSKVLTKSEASCTGSDPRLIYMSIMSRISSFETCFKPRLAWGALFKHRFQQYKGSGDCSTQTNLSIASARRICNSYAVNRYDHRLSSHGDPTKSSMMTPSIQHTQD